MYSLAFKKCMQEDIFYNKRQQKQIINTSLNLQGPDETTVVIMEECAELIQATSKCARKHDEARINLLEEMADVSICMMYLKKMYDISDEELNKAINVKLRRETIRKNMTIV